MCELRQTKPPVADRQAVEAAAEALRGKRTGVTYRDLARALKGCDARHVSSHGSHRTWKHDSLRDHLTIIDKGSGDVHTVYISKTRKFLLAIAGAI